MKDANSFAKSQTLHVKVQNINSRKTNEPLTSQVKGLPIYIYRMGSRVRANMAFPRAMYNYKSIWFNKFSNLLPFLTFGFLVLCLQSHASFLTIPTNTTRIIRSTTAQCSIPNMIISYWIFS